MVGFLIGVAGWLICKAVLGQDAHFISYMIGIATAAAGAIYAVCRRD